MGVGTEGMKRVVILGCGFGGLHAAQALKDEFVELTVIDRRNHHLFQPLLYQVATAAINTSDIATPIRSIVRGEHVNVYLDEAQRIDVENRRVICTDEVVPYDYLIVATGATHSYFGHPEWEGFAPGLKTIDDAVEIRRRVLLAFEAAEREPDPEKQKALMTFAIIGGGPTGVELAGALGEIAHEVLERDFHNIDPRQSRVVLIEGLPSILNAYPESLRQKAREQLERLGVEVRVNAMVTGVDEEGASIGDLRIPARTIIWGAGVAASPLGKTLGVPVDRAGRVKVTPELTVPGHPEVFVIGDLASLEEDGKPVPGVAPAAMQEGDHVAKNILRDMHGQPMVPFHYRDKGTFAVIGRGAAVGLAFKWKMSGVLAWFAWLLIHITYLIGFRNKVITLVNWAYSYLSLRRGARLITGEDFHKGPLSPEKLLYRRPPSAVATATARPDAPKAAQSGDGRGDGHAEGDGSRPVEHRPDGGEPSSTGPSHAAAGTNP